jgi:hypothetical protein
VGNQHGISKPALQRHAENHLDKTLAEAYEAADATRRTTSSAA